MTCATNGASAAVDLAGAAAEVADHPVVVEQAGKRLQVRRAPNSSARSRSHCPAADAKNSCDFVCRRAEHALEPPRVLVRAASSG